MSKFSVTSKVDKCFRGIVTREHGKLDGNAKWTHFVHSHKSGWSSPFFYLLHPKGCWWMMKLIKCNCSRGGHAIHQISTWTMSSAVHAVQSKLFYLKFTGSREMHGTRSTVNSWGGSSAVHLANKAPGHAGCATSHRFGACAVQVSISNN